MGDQANSDPGAQQPGRVNTFGTTSGQQVSCIASILTLVYNSSVLLSFNKHSFISFLYQLVPEFKVTGVCWSLSQLSEAWVTLLFVTGVEPLPSLGAEGQESCRF